MPLNEKEKNRYDYILYLAVHERNFFIFISFQILVVSFFLIEHRFFYIPFPFKSFPPLYDYKKVAVVDSTVPTLLNYYLI